jgi:hypothetical protein
MALTKAGAGTLAMTHVRAGTLIINQGAVSVPANGTNAAASRLTGLTIAGGTTPTARLDLANNAMVIDYTGSSPLATIAAQLKAGYNSGAWTGNGITSATAAANAGSAHKTALGIAEASAIGSPATFFGQDADPTSLLIRYTYSGDANLDGGVDTSDFNLLAANFNGSSKRWYQGDFNYDNAVDTLDFNALASNFGQALPAPAMAASLIPEPSSCATILSLLGLLSCARRRSSARVQAAH